MEAHNGSLHAFDVKYIRFPAVHPRLHYCCVTLLEEHHMEYQKYEARVKWKPRI